MMIEDWKESNFYNFLLFFNSARRMDKNIPYFPLFCIKAKVKFVNEKCITFLFSNGVNLYNFLEYSREVVYSSLLKLET